MEEKEISQSEAESSKKRKRFWIFLFIGLCTLFGILYAIWWYLQRPAVGEIRMNTVVTERNIDEEKKKTQYEGKYLTFLYETVYKEKSHTLPVKGPIKESIFLSSSDLEGKKLAIVVEERENGDFEASPGFQIRLHKPKEYERKDISITGYKGVLFIKNTVVFEQTFFLHDGNFVVTLSVTSPMSGEALGQELSDCIDSLRFLE